MSEDGLAPTVEQGRTDTRNSDDSGEMPLMVDRFVIEDELGAGGMGRVYVAYDPTLDRRVAVKLLRERIGIDVAKAHARMAREARAMARLRHPNVVTVHEVGTHERGVFIVMEYVAGTTLRAWLERDPAPDWKQIIAMYALAGRGLAAAHDAGLVHRDFKPDNVLVGDDSRVLVGDFGLANNEPDGPRTAAGSPSGPRLTRAGSVMGTPPYMSPEQHQGKPVDARTDQFAFCAALYEALYGVRPFAGDTDTEIAEHAIRGEITPPVRDRGAPPRVHAAILRGLRADPAERFPSLAALLAELERERRLPVRSIAAAASIALVATVAWLLVRDTTTVPAKLAPVGPIAVEAFAITLAHQEQFAWEDATADVIALTLNDIDGVKAVGPNDLLGPDRLGTPDVRAAEQRLGARTIVRGSIDERAGRLHAHITLVRPDGIVVSAIEVERATTAELPQLVADATRQIAQAIAPDRMLDASHATLRAQAMYRLGDAQLRSANFQQALPFLEQAVVADPKLFEAWYALALTRSWVLAPDSSVFAAVDAARATAPTATQRTLIDGVAQYLHHDLAKARLVFEPLVADAKLSQLELRDALYLLGEAHWHDGHHREGVGYFRRALDIDMSFKLPVQHISEYATANRDLAIMQPYAALIASSTSQWRDTAEFVQGHYDALARDGAPRTRLNALLVLGRAPPADLEASQFDADPLLHHIYDAARAYERGEPAAAHVEIDAIWKDVLARAHTGELAGNVYYSLHVLGDVLLCAEATDEIRRLVAFLAEQSHDRPVGNYARLSILAASLLGDRTLIVRRELTDRDRELADAIEAELGGDRAHAVELLEHIVRDPSPFWEFPERLALLRDLRALHRDKQVSALCEDTLHPAIFQLAFLPARRACR